MKYIADGDCLIRWDVRIDPNSSHLGERYQRVSLYLIRYNVADDGFRVYMLPPSVSKDEAEPYIDYTLGQKYRITSGEYAGRVCFKEGLPEDAEFCTAGSSKLFSIGPSKRQLREGNGWDESLIEKLRSLGEVPPEIRTMEECIPTIHLTRPVGSNDKLHIRKNNQRLVLAVEEHEDYEPSWNLQDNLLALRDSFGIPAGGDTPRVAFPYEDVHGSGVLSIDSNSNTKLNTWYVVPSIELDTPYLKVTTRKK